MSIIAHIGKPGSFSHMAARAKYGTSHTYLGCNSFADVFRSVSEGNSELGIVPLENSLAGSIYENYDLFNLYEVHIVAEQYLKVEHYLLAKKSGKPLKERLEEIKTVYSHPKALEQCESFFENHNWMKATAAQDTATASALVASSSDISIAAIGGLESSHLYRLQIVAKKIEDDRYNFTRFVYISKSKNHEAKNANKCSLQIELAHTPGSLVATLSVLQKYNLNMTKIESRPIHGKPFEYQFYLDFEFGSKGVLEKALSEMKKTTHKIKELGFYEMSPLVA